jgi:hypothetical protein
VTHSYGLLHHLAHNLNRTLEVEALTPRQQLSLGSTNLTAGLHLLLSDTGRVAASGISVAAQLPADGGRGSVDQAGNLAQAKTLGMTDLNSGALFNAKFGIRHRGSTVPERSGVALSIRRRPAYIRVKNRELSVFDYAQVDAQGIVLTTLTDSEYAA